MEGANQPAFDERLRPVEKLFRYAVDELLLCHVLHFGFRFVKVNFTCHDPAAAWRDSHSIRGGKRRIKPPRSISIPLHAPARANYFGKPFHVRE